MHKIPNTSSSASHFSNAIGLPALHILYVIYVPAVHRPCCPVVLPHGGSARTAQNHRWSAEALSRQPCCHHESARAIFRQTLAKGPGTSSISPASTGAFNRQGKINNTTATILSKPARIYAGYCSSICNALQLYQKVMSCSDARCQDKMWMGTPMPRNGYVSRHF